MVVNGYPMFLYKNKIVITGGSGRFGSELKKVKKNKQSIETAFNEITTRLNNEKKFISTLEKEFEEKTTE